MYNLFELTFNGKFLKKLDKNCEEKTNKLNQRTAHCYSISNLRNFVLKPNIK